ncbi:hypothetical protein BDV40DRAFT_272051 [Aspergillus tamarii]|uniref:Uncharacterized protein n=1 Tax=Aspergillus tamarii TaxID=41984 RepID=A0A5N6UMP1_ASPTM|nr:hypothetical protein BDV40DRAFT_272051 [Aspergillus tamarii]
MCQRYSYFGNKGTCPRTSGRTFHIFVNLVKVYAILRSMLSAVYGGGILCFRILISRSRTS